MTPVTSISEITTNTTMVGLMKLEPSSGRLMVGLAPAIQRNIPSATRRAMSHSLRVLGPLRRLPAAAEIPKGRHPQQQRKPNRPKACDPCRPADIDADDLLGDA